MASSSADVLFAGGQNIANIIERRRQRAHEARQIEEERTFQKSIEDQRAKVQRDITREVASIGAFREAVTTLSNSVAGLSSQIGSALADGIASGALTEDMIEGAMSEYKRLASVGLYGVHAGLRRLADPAVQADPRALAESFSLIQDYQRYALDPSAEAVTEDGRADISKLSAKANGLVAFDATAVMLKAIVRHSKNAKEAENKTLQALRNFNARRSNVESFGGLLGGYLPYSLPSREAATQRNSDAIKSLLSDQKDYSANLYVFLAELGRRTNNPNLVKSAERLSHEFTRENFNPRKIANMRGNELELLGFLEYSNSILAPLLQSAAMPDMNETVITYMGPDGQPKTEKITLKDAQSLRKIASEPIAKERLARVLRDLNGLHIAIGATPAFLDEMVRVETADGLSRFADLYRQADEGYRAKYGTPLPPDMLEAVIQGAVGQNAEENKRMLNAISRYRQMYGGLPSSNTQPPAMGEMTVPEMGSQEVPQALMP